MPRNSSSESALEPRRKTAREAAALLYFGLEKEYRQAKLKAAKNLGTRTLPSNLEVATELDRIAEETEGAARIERLIQMRKDALEIMKLLNRYCPILIGSVWRGTIKRTSDIDIEAYHDEPESVKSSLKAEGVKIQKTETVAVTEKGKTSQSFHIFAETPGEFIAEITVRNTEEMSKKRTCDTFGDEIKGLTIRNLEKVLKEHPSQQFLPF